MNTQVFIMMWVFFQLMKGKGYIHIAALDLQSLAPPAWDLLYTKFLLTRFFLAAAQIYGKP